MTSWNGLTRTARNGLRVGTRRHASDLDHECVLQPANRHGWPGLPGSPRRALGVGARADEGWKYMCRIYCNTHDRWDACPDPILEAWVGVKERPTCVVRGRGSEATARYQIQPAASGVSSKVCLGDGDHNSIFLGVHYVMTRFRCERVGGFLARW